MANYKKMYYELFRAYVKVIAILEKATKETEEIFINEKDPIELLNFEQSSTDNKRKQK